MEPIPEPVSPNHRLDFLPDAQAAINALRTSSLPLALEQPHLPHPQPHLPLSSLTDKSPKGHLRQEMTLEGFLESQLQHQVLAINWNTWALGASHGLIPTSFSTYSNSVS